MSKDLSFGVGAEGDHNGGDPFLHTVSVSMNIKQCVELSKFFNNVL